MAPSSRYEEIELLEADRDAQRGCKRRRPLGVAVAMMAVLGLAGFASLTQKPRSMKQHLAVVHKGLLKAFSPRALEDVAKLHTSIALSLHQEGRVQAAKMSMRATISKDKHPAPHPQLVIDVGAEKGKVKKLKKTLTQLLKSMPPPPAGHHSPLAQDLEEYDDGDDDEAPSPGDDDGEAPGDDGETPPPGDDDEAPSPGDDGEALPPGFKVVGKEKRDIVQIKVDIPLEGELEGEMEQSLDTEPTLSASVEFGRTLEEMCQHRDENMPMVFDGLKAHMDASFAATMAKVAQTMDEEYGEPAVGKEVAWLQVLSSVRANVELAYDDPKTLSDDLKNTFPPFATIVQMLASFVHSAPPDVQKAVKKLDGLSSGTRRIALKGLPHGYKLVLELDQFNLAPVLSMLLGDLEDLD